METDRILVTHDGTTNEFPGTEGNPIYGINQFRETIDVKDTVKTTELKQTRFKWVAQAEDQKVDVFDDQFLGDKIWSMRQMIKLTSSIIIQGTKANKHHRKPEVYTGPSSYFHKLNFGPTAPYFHNAIRLVGGQKEVDDILADPHAVTLVARSMVMRFVVDKVLSVPFFGCPARAKGDETSDQNLHKAQASLIMGKREAPELFSNECRKLAIELLTIMAPIYDLAPKRWGNRTAGCDMCYQFLYDIITTAGLISLALRVSPQPLKIVMPTPGSHYNYRLYSNVTASSEKLDSFPKHITEKKIPTEKPSDGVEIYVLSAVNPYIVRLETGTVVCHGEVVTYESYAPDTRPQAFRDGTVSHNFLFWLSCVFSIANIIKFLTVLLGLSFVSVVVVIVWFEIGLPELQHLYELLSVWVAAMYTQLCNYDWF